MTKGEETIAIVNELMEIGYKFKELMFRLNPTLFQSELTLTQISALQYIYHIPNITLKGLAECLVIAQSSASELVDRLVKMKYLERRVSPEDRRKIILNLSPKGKRFIEQHIKETKEFYEKSLSQLSLQEQREYLHAMKKFYEITQQIVNKKDKEEQ